MKVTTSHLDLIYITDSAGVGKTGLTFETAGLSAYWMRNNDSGETAITLVTMTLGTWVSGGFKEVDATNFPGLYQIGVPNAAVATGATSVVIGFKGVTDCVFTPLRIVLEEAKLPATIAEGDIANDAITAAAVKADAVTKIQNGLATPTNITAGTITTVTNLTNAPSNGDFTSTMKTSLNAATPSVSVTISEEDISDIAESVVYGIVAAPEISRLAEGTGSVAHVYTVLKGGGVAIPDVRVFVYSDAALTAPVARGTTDNFGSITFYLDAGTYYFVSVKAGYSFTNPDTEVVS